MKRTAEKKRSGTAGETGDKFVLRIEESHEESGRSKKSLGKRRADNVERDDNYDDNLGRDDNFDRGEDSGRKNPNEGESGITYLAYH